MTEKTLGMLALQNEPSSDADGIRVEYPFPVHSIPVPGAWADDVISGDPSLEQAFIETARQLEAQGVTAITADCGFTALYQRAVSAAVAVPVALSTLAGVPFLATALPPGKKIGILTADATKLTEAHFGAVGCVVAGMAQCSAETIRWARGLSE